MGILTAIASPLSGAMSDRIGPKAPLMMGLLGMAASMYMNSFMTLETEIARIMFPLCLRGFSMGFVLTPLTSIAVSQVPQAKLAQSSAITNEARQVGGSVGIAVFGSLLAHQTKLHLAGLGQQIDPHSAAFGEAMRGLGSFAMRVAGGGPVISAQRGRGLLMSRVGKTAFVGSVCDVFATASLILAIAVVPVLFIGKVRGKRGPKGIPSNERN